MQSVEEICSYITLIDRSKIILQGNVKRLRTKFSSNEYEIHFIGNMISFTTALWTGFELMSHTAVSKTEHIVKVKPLNNSDINALLGAIIGTCKVKLVREQKASMNDIFIRAIEANQEELKEEGSNE
jgi:ABC-2 type transport system ATP-binding protein